MIKIVILAAVLLSTGFVWVRSQWARSKNAGTSRQIIKDLQSGKHDIESYAEALNILIKSIPLSTITDFAYLKQKMEILVGKLFSGKYTIQYATINNNGNGILLAEAKIKEVVAGYHTDKEIDMHLPCRLYIAVDTVNNKIDFKSTFPETKDHYYVLEDLAEGVVKHLIK
jgi:hypothetical protein